MPVAFPESDSRVELEILRRFFDPEEAAIALELSMLPETAEKIHRRCTSRRALARRARHGLEARPPSLEQVRHGLAALAEKKVVNSGRRRSRGGERRLYGKLPFAVGIYEMQVDRLSRDFESEARSYMDEAFMHDFVEERPRQMRTIPINEKILPDRNVSRYDSIRELIHESRGPFVVQNCICRQGRELMGEECGQTDLKETCLAIGAAALGVMREGRGTRLSREETLAFLEQAEREGLVLQGQNSRDPLFICCCCSCCCAILSRVKRLPNPGELLQSPYRAEVAAESCVGCGKCLARCPVDAIQLERRSESAGGTGFTARSKGAPAGRSKRRSRVAEVDPLRCIGCGLCLGTCPPGAISFVLKRGRRSQNPPTSTMNMYVKMFLGRFGIIKGGLLLAKAGLGFKV